MRNFALTILRCVDLITSYATRAQYIPPTGRHYTYRRLNALLAANSNISAIKPLLCLQPTNAMKTALPEKLRGNQLVRKFPKFYETHMLIIALTSARHLSLSSARSIHAYPSHFLKIHFTIIAPSMPMSSKWSLYLRSPNQNPVCTTHVSHAYHIPAYIILLNLSPRNFC